MIQFFQKSLKPFIRAQLDAQSWELDSWEEAVKKVVNVEAKALLQSSSNTRDMNSRCPQGNKPVKKEQKESRKTKFTNISSADASSSKY